MKALNLSLNQIERIENLDKATNLRDLRLHSNRITEVDGLARLRELTSLALQYNCIETLGSSLAHLRKLKVLRIDHNKLADLGTLPRTLVDLDISGNALASLKVCPTRSPRRDWQSSLIRLHCTRFSLWTEPGRS